MLSKIDNYINSNFQKHIEKAQEFLRLPSISLTNYGLEETSGWLFKELQNLGGTVERIGTVAPLIFAKFVLGRPKTLLVYGMYDVQPNDGQTWISPPFEANISELPGIGPSIIARGACNSKGPLIGFLNVIESLMKVDKIPVNLVLVIEGEEEIGSPKLSDFFMQNKKWLKSNVDAAFEPFWAEYGTDVNSPIISLGSKGIISLEIICKGGKWGGPVDHPVHSSVGAWLASPVIRLIRAIGTFMDEYENIRIENFNEDVIPPSAEDEKLLNELNKSFSESLTIKTMGARKFKFNEHGADLLRKYLFSPSIQLGTLTHAEGDVIAPEAKIKLNVRLVPGMKTSKTVDRIQEHLNKHGFGDLEIRTIAQYPCSRTSLNAKVVKDLLETYKEFGVEPQIWPFLASATPYYLFSEILDIPYAWGGLGKAGNSHTENEYATLEGLKLFEKSIARFLYKFAQD
jgi:acetylornithine deacetylase/succinyl-diaminopimelate desuccinylase-like protein